MITVINGEKNINTIPIKHILSENFSGVYTACRTFNRTNIFEYHYHLKRLSFAKKITPINFDTKEVMIESSKESFPIKDVENYISPSLKLALREMMNTYKLKTEMRIYMILTPRWDEWITNIKNQCEMDMNLFDILIRVEELPDPPKGSSEVEVRMIGGRKDPSYKYNSWIKECDEYLKKKGPNVEEILLSDKNKNLFEGMSSNFFAVQKEPFSIVTAPQDTVLQGTVSQVVLDYCKENGLQVIYKNPNLEDIPNWSSCFITSTTRQVLSVSTINLLGSDDVLLRSYKIDSDSCPTFQRIRNHYVSFVEKNSFSIF